MLSTKKSILPLIILLISNFCLSQISAPFFGNQQFISGYEKTILGENIPYFSIYPNYAKEALLTRCTDGQKVIEWETSALPKESTDKYAYLIWISGFSCGTSSGIRNFDLFVNDIYALTFTTYPNQYYPYMTYAAKDSTRIVLEYKIKDWANDAHGFTYLRIPLSKYQKGKPLKIKIVGKNQNSNDWYMTFKYSFKEKVDVIPMPFLLKNGMQLIKINVLHFGSPTTLFVAINGRDRDKFFVKNGFNTFEVPVVAAVKEKTKVTVGTKLGNILHQNTSVNLKPITYREIDLVHHSHTDIGYSHIQEDVIKIHNRNIRTAISLIHKTKNYPEGARFIWNIESSWVVENFLSEATDVEKKDFYTAVKNGQIVISSNYANILTGLSTPEEMQWITLYSRNLKEKQALPVKTAMMSDIPGLSWSMVSALAQNGVRYFSNGPNYVESYLDKGDRIGNTLVEQGNKAFWWRSSNKKDSILMWTCGKGYSSWHGTAQGAVIEKGPDKIANYINELDSINYPYDIVQWRYNIVADNGPTDSTICDFVKNWNEKYVSPKLVLANVTDMFERFEKKYGNHLITYSGDFTPYWEDGAYSTAKEEALNRELSQRILQYEKVQKQQGFTPNNNDLYQAKKNILLFHEHTWGAWCSISKPDDEFTTHQWDYKKRFLDSALYYVNRIESSIKIPPTISAAPPLPQVKIINTSNFPQTNYTEITRPERFKGNTLIDEKGNKITVQNLTNNKIGFVAKDVPANGEMKYRFSDEKNPPSFESPIKFTIDSMTGSISNLFFSDKQWVDKTIFKGLAENLYVKGFNPKIYTSTKVEKIELIESGPVLKKYQITCSMNGASKVIYEISHFTGLDHLKISVMIDKKAVREKEAIHIAFPFDLKEAITRIGIDDTFITPEKGQIAGSNKDFFSVQRWIDVSDKNFGVTISSPQGALYEIGKPVNEESVNNGAKKWKKEAQSSSTIFLYALNNYWHTNYKIDQDGKIQFDFYLQFHNNFDDQKAKQFGYKISEPLLKLESK